MKGVGIHKHQSMEKDDNNRYGWINDDLSLVRSHVNNCFAELSGFGGQYKKMDYLLLQIQDEVAKEHMGWNEEGFHLYYEWLFNYSHLRSAFVHKNVSRVLKDRVVVIDPNVDARMFIVAANAVRIFWECYYEDNYLRLGEKIRIWADLVNMGQHPDVAFALCHGMMNDIKLGYHVSPYPSGLGHEFLDGLGVKHLNFIEGNLNLNGKSFKELGRYDGIGILYTKARTDAFHLVNFIHQRWGKVKNESNPFAKPVMSSAYLNRDAFLSTLKEISADYSAKLKELNINVKA